MLTNKLRLLPLMIGAVAASSCQRARAVEHRADAAQDASVSLSPPLKSADPAPAFSGRLVSSALVHNSVITGGKQVGMEEYLGMGKSRFFSNETVSLSFQFDSLPGEANWIGVSGKVKCETKVIAPDFENCLLADTVPLVFNGGSSRYMGRFSFSVDIYSARGNKPLASQPLKGDGFDYREITWKEEKILASFISASPEGAGVMIKLMAGLLPKGADTAWLVGWQGAAYSLKLASLEDKRIIPFHLPGAEGILFAQKEGKSPGLYFAFGVTGKNGREHVIGKQVFRVPYSL